MTTVLPFNVSSTVGRFAFVKSVSGVARPNTSLPHGEFRDKKFETTGLGDAPSAIIISAVRKRLRLIGAAHKISSSLRTSEMFVPDGIDTFFVRLDDNISPIFVN